MFLGTQAHTDAAVALEILPNKPIAVTGYGQPEDKARARRRAAHGRESMRPR